MAETKWYAVKTRPGTQRKAKPRIGEPEDRAGEFIIERNLRDAGFEVFMPSMVREVRHHKTDEYMVKRFPLMVGYSFVPDPRNFFALSQVEGVSSILGIAGRPFRIATGIIDSIREAEEREAALLELRQQARKKREAQKGQKLTRKEAREMFPKNTRIIVTGESFLAGMSGFIVDATGRKRIKAVVETLNGLMPVELGIADFAEAS